MRRCTSCGTRLSPEAHRCWLCHAAAPSTAPATVSRPEPEAQAPIVARDHVWAGPLQRASQHGEPDPVANPARSDENEPMWFGVRARLLVLVLAVFLAIATTGMFVPLLSRTFVYGIFATALSALALHRVWRREHVA